MKYLKSHQDFILRLDESMLYFSNSFRKNLKKVDSPISKELLGVEWSDVKPDMTFIEPSDKEGYVNFSQIDNVQKVMDEPLVDEDTGEVVKLDLKRGVQVHQPSGKDFAELKGWLNTDSIIDQIKSRNQVKLGKLVNKIFPGKFSDKDVEDFVNKFKAIGTKDDIFELVSETDIPYWYHCKRYAEEKGTLGSSCMRKMDDEVFQIYSRNPDVCRMLILKNENEELLARALIWKVNISQYEIRRNPELGDIEYFMDRIYFINDSDVNKFKNFAEEKGWAYKTQQNYSSHTSVTFNGKEYYIDMNVKLDSTLDYDRYPYMDTFATLSGNVLYNTEEYSAHDGILLQDTGGGHISGHWSEYHGENIPEDEGVWSEQVDSFLWRDRAVYVEHCTSYRYEGWYPEDSDYIIYDDELGAYINIDDGVYSEYSGQMYFVENVRRAIIEVDDYNGSVNSESEVHEDNGDFLNKNDIDDYDWFEKMDYLADWSDYDMFLESLFTKDYNGDWIPKMLVVTTYKFGDDWYTKGDMELLNKSIDEEEDRVEDKITYFERVWVKENNPFKAIENGRESIKKMDPKTETGESYLDSLKKSIDKLEELIDFYSEIDDSVLSDLYVKGKYGDISEKDLKKVIFDLSEEFIDKWVNGELIGSKTKNTYDVGSTEKITLADKALIEMRGNISRDNPVFKMDDEDIVQKFKDWILGRIIWSEVKFRFDPRRNWAYEPDDLESKNITRQVSKYKGEKLDYEKDIYPGILFYIYHSKDYPRGMTTANFLTSLFSYENLYYITSHYRRMVDNINESKIKSFSQYFDL